MNLAEARVVVRPRTETEILDLAAMWCFTADRWLYARLAAVVSGPALGACIAARWWAEWTWPQVWLLAIALATVTQGVFTIATSRALFERHVRARVVLAHFARRLPSYLVALVVTRIILAATAASVVLLPSGWVRVAMVHETSLLEAGAPIAATRRASALATGRVPEIALLLGGFGLALIVGVTAVELLGHGLVDVVLQLGQPFGNLFDDGGSAYALVGFHLAVPYIAVARFLGYLDLRTRGDGWDIQVRFMALAAEDARQIARAS